MLIWNGGKKEDNGSDAAMVADII